MVDMGNQLLYRPEAFVASSPLAHLRPDILRQSIRYLILMRNIALSGHPVRVRRRSLAYVGIAKRHSGVQASAVTAVQMGLFEHAIIPRLQLGQDVLERDAVGSDGRVVMAVERRCATVIGLEVRRRWLEYTRRPR
ncbi:carbamoyl-phosphate synthase arginine-specific large chain [Pseudozyma hubeiensis SY62]|uniref:Carbamoyl-phosphate synthase arginine-specific large chain n=1 Tax=Pseudozyma hubeiensis (strain SY62) TaxID=1305764 RepID=R9P315_PSEHS|nr:carbamoyl-phosphate synthase arginine-specific large chain [Pseudozyma hubeiensis SY62]GAC95647.1 carbamoyl-phosphate synthase arginine-specific large chain [Pseudozyma hubeiensis SY62]